MSASAHLNFRIADEGYLWYGTQRVMAGEIPLGDFMAYDPGRYYLAALGMLVFGNHGLVAVNLCEALLGAIGLWLVIALISRGRQRSAWWFYLLAAASVLLWMVPRAKTFDIVASVVLVVLLAWLIASPTRFRCFINGVGLGLIAIIGRNHGLYGAVADVSALAFLVWVERRANLLPSFFSWGAGVLVGYSPMLLAAIFVSGFWSGLWESVRVYFEVGATNTNLPIPWPWLLNLHRTPGVEALRYLLHGTLLIGMPLLGLAVVIYSGWSVRVKHRPVNPVLLAAGLLAIPYTHHAFARAGLGHLAQAIQPMLIIALILVAGLPRSRQVVAAISVLLVSALLMLPTHEGYTEWREGNWVSVQAGPDTLRVPHGVAAQMTALQQLIGAYAPEGREFVAVPEIAGAYALVDRRAAVWDTYPVFPTDAPTQQLEIARIRAERPAFVLIGESRERDPYSYPHTHPLVFDFILKHFTQLDAARLPEGLRGDVYLPLADGSK